MACAQALSALLSFEVSSPKSLARLLTSDWNSLTTGSGAERSHCISICFRLFFSYLTTVHMRGRTTTSARVRGQLGEFASRSPTWVPGNQTEVLGLGGKRCVVLAPGLSHLALVVVFETGLIQPGWPQVHHTAEDDLELLSFPAPMLESQMCILPPTSMRFWGSNQAFVCIRRALCWLRPVPRPHFGRVEKQS